MRSTSDTCRAKPPLAEQCDGHQLPAIPGACLGNGIEVAPDTRRQFWPRRSWRGEISYIRYLTAECPAMVQG